MYYVQMSSGSSIVKNRFPLIDRESRAPPIDARFRGFAMIHAQRDQVYGDPRLELCENRWAMKATWLLFFCAYLAASGFS